MQNKPITTTDLFNFFPIIREEIRLLPKQRQVSLLQKLLATTKLGLRALILSELRPENKEELEEIIMDNQENYDSKLILFGKKYIPDFDNKFMQIIAEISEKFIKTVKNYQRQMNI